MIRGYKVTELTNKLVRECAKSGLFLDEQRAAMEQANSLLLFRMDGLVPQVVAMEPLAYIPGGPEGNIQQKGAKRPRRKPACSVRG